MTDTIFTFTSPLLKKARTTHIPVIPLTTKTLKSWKNKQNAHVKTVLDQSTFSAKPKQTQIITDKTGCITAILMGLSDPANLYDTAHTAAHIRSNIAEKHLKTCSFYLEPGKLKTCDLENLHLGWLLSGYNFARYKGNALDTPKLVADKAIDTKRITAFAESLFFMRNMINTPAHDMGPQDIEDVAAHMAETFKADLKVIKGKTLENKFPLIHAVGKAAEDSRYPRLVELNWGKDKDPKVTLVGKGVAFDTGGLNLKPGQYMKLMKKDMGGAAHTLGVAYLVMALKLPVRLKVLVPAVENSISGPAFRPGDVLPTRKGITVENTNTDAEGRLILADSLTYACESDPELLIDFATLTGSARAALGHDIPAMFCNNDKLAVKLRDVSMDAQDPLWPMPLWQNYRKHIESKNGDIVNSAAIPGDLIYSALFLETFLPDEKKDRPDWIHIDTFAWESHGHAGRPTGAADCGLRAVFGLLEQRYG